MYIDCEHVELFSSDVYILKVYSEEIDHIAIVFFFLSTNVIEDNCYDFIKMI